MTMWNDFTVGTAQWGNTAVKAHNFAADTPCFISENQTSYWISGAYLDTGFRIAKSTSEGKALAEMIAARKTDEVFHEFLTKLVLKHIEPTLLKISDALILSFENGREYQAAAIRAALML